MYELSAGIEKLAVGRGATLLATSLQYCTIRGCLMEAAPRSEDRAKEKRNALYITL